MTNERTKIREQQDELLEVVRKKFPDASEDKFKDVEDQVRRLTQWKEIEELADTTERFANSFEHFLQFLRIDVYCFSD